MNDPGDRTVAVTALKRAVPYIRLFKHKTFVIKAGGAVFAEAETMRALVEQVGILHQVGIRTVLVHGGGPQSTELARALGLETQIVEGRRVTDDRALDVSAMVLNGMINTRLLAACRDLEIPAVGLSGIDAGLIRARRRPPVTKGEKTIDYGHVGDILSVDPTVLQKHLDSGLMPIVSPLSCDERGNLLNINADTVAAALAARLNAEKLVLVTGAPGILEDENDPSSLVSYTDLSGLQQLRQNGSLSAGMLPKADAIAEALTGGVQRVHLISYNVPDSLLLEVFTNEGAGTLVVRDIEALSPAEQAGAE
ncbi:MAG: acetylglutamate kinase [Planctomycetota bacterium]